MCTRQKGRPCLNLKPTLAPPHLFKVFDSFEVEPLLIEQLQVLVVQLVSPHLVLLLLLLHLEKSDGDRRGIKTLTCPLHRAHRQTAPQWVQRNHHPPVKLV